MLRGGALLVVALWSAACASVGMPTAKIRFPSLAEGTTLDGYLWKPAGEGRRPAVVLLHGCGGLFSVSTGQMQGRDLDWAKRLVDHGYAVLLVDSFSPRGIGQMCSQQAFNLSVYLERPKDAYGALAYLQAQPFVRPDRVAVMGWSQGGGVVLLGVRADSLGRPRALPNGDFRAAIAFYPASCREGAHRLPWTSAIPLLVLMGADDNWTPSEPCKSFVDAAARRGAPIAIRLYPGAYHDFDWPDLAVKTQPAYRTASGAVPVTGMDPGARADALARVPEFLSKHLGD